MSDQNRGFLNTAPAKNTNEEVIDLRVYFSILNKYKWRIGFLAIAVTLLAAVYAINITPIYRATATLLIEEKANKAVSFEDIIGVSSNQTQFYLTQIELLKSAQIATRVIEQLKLDSHPGFVGDDLSPGEPKLSLVDKIRGSLPFLPVDRNQAGANSQAAQDAARMNTLVGVFSKRLTISPVAKTQLVQVSFESSDPGLAALVANTVGEVYISQHLDARMATIQEAADWLTTRLADLQIKLDASEQRLQTYRQKEGLIDIQGVLSLVSDTLSETSRQLTAAKTEKSKLDSAIAVLKNAPLAALPTADVASVFFDNTLLQGNITAIDAAELKLSALSKEFGPKHPIRLVAQEELDVLRAKKVALENRLLAELQTKRDAQTEDLRIEQSNALLVLVNARDTIQLDIAALEDNLAKNRAEYQGISQKETTYRQLVREVETNRNIYDTFFTRAKETQVTSDFNSAIARFTDRAVRPNLPAKPNKKLIVVLAFVAAFGLGVVIAFVVEALNDTVKSARDVEQKLSQRMLGLLPLVGDGKANMLLHYFFDDLGKKFAEAVRTLRTSFVLTQLGKDTQIIEVTSTQPGEGKTTTSTNLAFSLGQMEKVLLIDGDMRKPSIGNRFDLAPYHPGLANLIAGTASFEDCVVVDEASGITVMPAGQIPPNPLELLSAPEFATLLAGFKKDFDRIVIDTAPIQAVSDGLIIAQQADAVIYVVKSDVTRMGAIENGLGRLMAAHAKIAGVVLNQVDSKKLSDNDYYHGYYNDYTYGDTPTSGSKKDGAKSKKARKTA